MDEEKEHKQCSAGSDSGRCKHETLRFHSGGHYVQCDDCKAWWIATKNAHTPEETVDFDRSSKSNVLGGDARRLITDDAQPTTEPIGYAAYHPKLGWRTDLAEKSEQVATAVAMRSIESAAQQGWTIQPLYAAQPPAAPVDLTNHHNALKCPYCNPRGLQFAEPHERSSAGNAQELLELAHRIERCNPTHMVGAHTRPFLYRQDIEAIVSALRHVASAQPQEAPETDGALRQLLERPRDIDDRVILGEIKDTETVYLKANGAEFRKLRALVASSLPRPKDK